MFSPFDLPPGILFLVTDQLAAPADFILHRALAEPLKSAAFKASGAPKRAQALVLSVSEPLAQWREVYDVAGFKFVDVLACVESGIGEGQGKAPLRPVLDVVVAALGAPKGEGEEDTDTDTLVFLDDLAALEWLGVAPAPDLTRFANATLLIRQHVLAPEPDDGDVLRALREQCTFHVEVRPLASGRSGTVSGQSSLLLPPRLRLPLVLMVTRMTGINATPIALHAGPGVPLGYGGVRLLPRSAALQYRLTDAGAVFFERGTGAGML
ncbi:hypothetical protein FB451DRAFT_1162838 [Mycena latifolia]|nr:hypothetical protein FB451DRAFT_1162838 [Mycena latifolia]